jgi:putative ABC transport system permease protein
MRQLLRSPGFSLTAIVSLALGLGVNTTIFSLARSVLFKQLDVPEAGRLVRMYRGHHSPFTYPDYQAFAGSRAFSQLVAEESRSASLQRGSELPGTVRASFVSANFFPAMRVAPTLGRVFVRGGDDVPGAEAEAVVSDAFWRESLGADSAAVGRTVRINGRDTRVVGVLPPTFRSSLVGMRVDLLVPMADAPILLGSPPSVLSGGLYVTGRLAPGVSREAANGEVQRIMADLRRTLPDEHQDMTVRLDDAAGLTAELRGGALAASGLLLFVTLLVVVLACTNVGNLVLTRNFQRRKEIGVRLALGASRWRVVRLLLTESAVLAAAAGVLSVLMAAWSADLVAALLPADAPVWFDLTPDARVVGYASLIAGLAILLSGLIPALSSVSGDVNAAIKEGAATSTPARSRLRSGFLFTQVGLSTLLLVIALLFTRSLVAARHVDPGFPTRNLLDMRVELTAGRYDQASAATFFDALHARLTALPGVVEASAAATVPLTLNRMETGVFLHEASAGTGDRHHVDFNVVGPAYFATLGIPLTDGREFTTADNAGVSTVAVVNQSLARQLWPGGGAIGREFSFDGPAGPWVRVVGVARDIRYNALSDEGVAVVYLPYAQQFQRELVVQARVRPGAPLGEVSRAMSDAVRALDPALAAAAVRLTADDQRIVLLPSQLAAALFGSFGILALVLAAVGMFGVAAFTVAQRTREIGIRTALGARPGQVVRSVLGGTLRLVGLGAVAGLLVALGVSRALAHQLYGVPAADPLTFSVVPLLLAVTALGAAVVPARRAVRVEPAVALRD